MAPEERLCVVILAAGRGRRLGRDKATLPWGPTVLVRHVFDQFPVERVARRIVVVNARNRTAVRQALAADVQIVVNPDMDAEMISSVCLGLQAQAGADGPLCIHPVDVFAISAELVTQLHEAWRADRARIHVPTVAGRGAHPLIVPQRFAAAIHAIPPGCGLNLLLREHAAEVVRHAWSDERLIADLDTPEDYARYQPPAGLTHSRALRDEAKAAARRSERR